MQHQMELVQKLADGVEEWRCPTCQRRFLMQWDPYKKNVLNEGDSSATHSGAKGGVNIQTTVQPDPQIMSDDLRDALDNFLQDLDSE